MNNQTKNYNFTVADKLLSSLLIFLLLLLTIQLSQVFLGINDANANETKPMAVSVGGFSKDLSTLERQKIVKENLTLPDRNLTIGEPTGMVRGDTLANGSVSINSNSYREFYIYDGYSAVYDDFDEDGYYQTFNVVFDADVFGQYSNEQAFVYADLYLSRNGGPWVHYFSTDVFDIYGDSSDDTYEVLTTLYEGWGSDYYEVLIDLYDVDSNGVVATYSSADTDALYGLPLESSDYDTYYEEEYHYHDDGGSFSYVAMILMLVGLSRRFGGRN